MAEALGIAGSIVGILTLADDVASKGIRLYRSIKDCPQEIKTLVDETDRLCGILGTLKRQIRALIDPNKATESHIHANSLLSGCEETLKMVDEMLTKSGTKPGETWANAVKRMKWKYRKEDTIELLNRLERHKTGFQLALSLDGMESLQKLLTGNSEIIRHVLESKNETIQEIQDSKTELLLGLEKIDDRQIQAQVSEQQRQKDNRRHEALSWLSQVDFKAKHNEIQRNRCEDTGKWLLESPGFTSWLDQVAPATLWCQGTPGAGKTYMTSTILDHLESRFPNDDVGIACIYFDFKQQTSQTPELIFSSILQQLAYRKSNLDPTIDSLYEKFRNGGKRPLLAELVSAIRSISQHLRVAYIVFDALDECDEKTQREGLFSCLRELSQAPFKILATSRPHPLDIQTAFKEAGTVTIYAHSDDIEPYVRKKIEDKRSTGIKISPELTTTIVKQILLKAEGIFLLAAFQIDHILRHASPKDKRKAANNLTSDLRIIYGSIMAAIDKQPQTRESTLNILGWISAVTRPLHFHELQIAVSIEDEDTEVDEEGFLDAKTMIDLCGGLVAIEQETGTVRFVHYTVQEYLLSNTITIDKVHFNIAKTCLNYFSFGAPTEETITETNNRLWGYHSYPPSKEKCFWDYTACNWGFHIRAANELGDLSAEALDILQSSDLLHALARTAFYKEAWGFNADYLRSSPLHIASYLGLVRLVQLLLENSLDPNIKCYGKTPLLFAAENGHEAVVRLLVDREDVDADPKDEDGRIPLLYAARGGHEAVVRLLVDREGVDADSKDRYGMTPLLYAASGGHEAVVRLLVDREDVDADSKDRYGMTPLSYAASRGHEAVVRLLVDREDVDADSKDGYGRTPLSYAASRGHEAVVRLLVDREDVDADSKNDNGRTPLSYAASEGHEAVVCLLVDREDVDADSKDQDSRTPLSFAVSEGHEAVVRLLVGREDVDADSKDGYGRTPLSHAASRGHEAVVRLLVGREDVDADSKDQDSRTPLSFAASEGHEAVVRLLVGREDVDADSKDENGKTPLFYANLYKKEASSKILAERLGIDVDESKSGSMN